MLYEAPLNVGKPLPIFDSERGRCALAANRLSWLWRTSRCSSSVQARTSFCTFLSRLLGALNVRTCATSSSFLKISSGNFFMRIVSKATSKALTLFLRPTILCVMWRRSCGASATTLLPGPIGGIGFSALLRPIVYCHLPLRQSSIKQSIK